MNFIWIILGLALIGFFGWLAYKGYIALTAAHAKEQAKDPDDRNAYHYVPGLLMLVLGGILGAFSLWVWIAFVVSVAQGKA